MSHVTASWLSCESPRVGWDHEEEDILEPREAAKPDLPGGNTQNLCIL